VNGGLKARLYAISSICIAYLPALFSLGGP
jgi:hypothetical protein